MGLLITRLVQLIGAVALVVAVWWFGSNAWDNHQFIGLCRDDVTEKVNAELTALKVPTVSAVDFYETSVLFGIPPKISFGKSIPNIDPRGSAYMGNVEGAIDIPARSMKFDVKLGTGDSRSFERKLFE